MSEEDCTNGDCLATCNSLTVPSNKINCRDRFGFEKTAQDCVEMLPAVSQRYKYNLKHKYECLTDPNSKF